MRLAFDIVALALLLLVLAAAALFGMLMNFLVLWLMLAVAWLAVTRVVTLIRHRLYFGIWKPGEYPASRPYLIQAVLRCCFWITVGLAVYLSLVPIQFSGSDWTGVLLTVWGSAAVLCLLEWVPSRRIPWATNIGFALVFVFLAFQLAKMYLPYGGSDAVVIEAPFEGTWYTIQGGNSCLINHHYYAGSQGYALDLSLPEDGPLDVEGEPDLERYRTFGQPLYCPVDGLVVEVENNRPDLSDGGLELDHPAGNFVTIKTDSGAFVLLAHLQQGTVLVEKDDHVSAGQPLAKCGNSGNSSAPHLHIQAMTGQGLFSSTSRPLVLNFKSDEGISGPFQRNDVIQGLVPAAESSPSQSAPDETQH